MSAPLLPSPLDYIGLRRFAFYPPIAHSDPNEWLLGRSARAEVQVVNVHTGREIWIPRQHIGAVSETSDALLVVGLTKALKFREGSIEPERKEVIEIPSGPGGTRERRFRIAPPDLRPAPVVAIRLASKTEWSLPRVLVTTCTGALVVALLAALITAAIRF